MPIQHNMEHILVDNDLPVRVIVHRVNTYKLHWHPQAEIVFVVKGSTRIHIDGGVFVASEKTLIFIPANEPHALCKSDSENLLIAIQFDYERFKTMPDIDSKHFDNRSFFEMQRENPSQFDALRQMCIQITWQYNKQPAGYRYLVSGMMSMLLGGLLQTGCFREHVNNQIQMDKQNYIHDIVNYIEQHYTENISLQEIADRQHISYFHLSRTFKEVTGITFREHLGQIRLHKSTADLRTSRDSILNIAMKYGFPNAKSYSSAFQKRYGITPGEYRRHYTKNAHPNDELIHAFEVESENSYIYSSMNDPSDLSLVYNLLSDDTMKNQALQTHEKRILDVKMNAHAKPLSHTWSRIGSVARAADLLRADVREQVARTIRECGVEYLRFHAIFCDEMMVLNRTVGGEYIYNWLYVDKILDFLLENHCRPFLELSFTPTELASSANTLFFYHANVSMPNDLKRWADMVSALIAHCCNRYGRHEVAQWMVEVWNEPDYQDVFFEGTQQDYLRLYQATALAVKKTLPELRIGGPAITHIHYTTTDWIHNFIVFCQEQQVPFDFISYHVYADMTRNYGTKADNPLFPSPPNQANIIANSEMDLIETHKRTIQADGCQDKEEIVSEWSLSAKPRFRIRDTCYMLPYIIRTALLCRDRVQGLCFWCITDLMEELKAQIKPFQGGLGLIDVHGIPKAAYFAFVFLNHLGKKVIQEGPDYIVTQKESEYQILVWNLCEFDEFSKSMNFTTETSTDLYTLFKNQPLRKYVFMLSDLSGRYKISRMWMDRENGSAYDHWLKMGSPADMTPEEVTFLKAVSRPSLACETVDFDTQKTLTVDCPIHGACLLRLTPCL